MSRSFTYLTTILVFTFAMGGCNWTAAPTLHPVGISPGDKTDEAVVYRYSIRADNKTDVELPLIEMRYQFFLSGHPVYQGRYAVKRTVPPHDSAVVQVPVVIRSEYLTDDQLTGSTALQGRLFYKTPGKFVEALYDLGIRRPVVSFYWTSSEPQTDRKNEQQ